MAEKAGFRGSFSFIFEKACLFDYPTSIFNGLIFFNLELSDSLLVAKGETYPISHDLLLILEKILSFDAEAEALRDDLAILMPYAVEIRYPDDWFMPSERDTKEAREAVNHVLNWLKTRLPDLFNKTEEG